MRLSETLALEYQELWNTMTIPEKHIEKIEERAKLIVQLLANRYIPVAQKTSIPWAIIACIHSMEANLDFRRHLHNGDPLTDRTTHIPVGRPKTGHPPFSWEESAIDVLMSRQIGKEPHDWTIPDSLYFLEAYNGFGYRVGRGQATTPPQRSPYLWSFTNHYIKGKFISDGRFDPNARSTQIGAAPLLQQIYLFTDREF